MESDVTQSAIFYKTWGWIETHRRQVLVTLAVVLALGVIIGFLVYRNHEREVSASNALSTVTTRRLGAVGAESAEAIRKVAEEYGNTEAGQRARLLAAARLFTDGKYTEAQAEFEKFLKDSPDSPFLGQALAGVATSLDSQGKTDDAVAAYRRVIERVPKEHAAAHANLALGRILESKGDFKGAMKHYQDVTRAEFPSLAGEAGLRLQALVAAHPELMPAQPAMTNAPAVAPKAP